MSKFKQGDRIRVVGSHPLKGEELVVSESIGGGYYAKTASGLTWWVPTAQAKAPASPVKQESAGSRRANTLCPRCGKKRNACSCLEDKLVAQLADLGVEVDAREYKFAEEYGRVWRTDLAWPARKLLVEVEGGSYVSRHRSREGYANDLEKYNFATMLGFRVLRYDTGMVTTGKAAREVAHVVKNGLRPPEGDLQ